ncbi:MAG TPA: hypothetical protein VK788_09470 [Terriglobales bacterium]|nr:hypothetical protein [Terriglobales bacterium]
MMEPAFTCAGSIFVDGAEICYTASEFYNPKPLPNDDPAYNIVRSGSEWLERVQRAVWLFKKFQHRSFR